MPQFKVERKQIIHMGIRTQYFMVTADSAEEAEQNVLDELEECYASDYDIEQTEDLKIIVSEK